MIQKIEVLDQTTIDKIAAGEVVERPASVVKELVENALDAKATAVTVEIREGGIDLIRITDNGSGIPADQVRTAFLRHATSKIRTVEELTGIASLGFRGEALSSIAAVSQVEMITRVPDVLQGVRYLIEGGKEVLCEEVGAPSGTTFLVRNLFYNTPARRKFLRTPVSEASAVGNVVEQLALSHPEVSFKYMVNGQTKLHTSGNRNLRELVYNIYGREIARELIEIHGESELMKISGFIGKPVVSRGNRNFENYYVNHRYVKSSLLAKAIEDGYHTSMMQHKYPFTLLYLELDGNAVDVNVHPTKMELRFSRQEEIYRQLTETVSRTLREEEQIVHVTFDQRPKAEKQEKKEDRQIPEPFETRRLRQISGRPSAPGSESRKMPIYPSDQKTRTFQVAEKNPYLTREEDALFEKKPAEQEQRKDRSAGMRATPQPEKQSSDLSEKGYLPEKEEKPNPLQPDRKETEKSEDGMLHPGCREKQEETVKQQQKRADEREESGTLQSKQKESDQASERKQESAAEQLQLFQDPMLSEQARKHHTIIGQVFDTFWLVQYQDSLYIIDQHAAHEKVLFERMMKNYREKKVLSQMMSPPQIITLSDREAELLERYLELFESFGYQVSSFGGKEYAISAVPHNLYGIPAQDLFVEILDHLEETGEKPLDIITEKLASMSCKAAVKGNHRMSRPEIEELIGELLTLEDPYHCPHGRPTIISISKQEMEKKFKRIV